MKSTFQQHLANGISKLFRYTSFANIAHFIASYEKHMPLTNDGITIRELSKNVYKLSIDFGDTSTDIELVFSTSSGRMVFQEVR